MGVRAHSWNKICRWFTRGLNLSPTRDHLRMFTRFLRRYLRLMLTYPCIRNTILIMCSRRRVVRHQISTTRTNLAKTSLALLTTQQEASKCAATSQITSATCLRSQASWVITVALTATNKRPQPLPSSHSLITETQATEWLSVAQATMGIFWSLTRRTGRVFARLERQSKSPYQTPNLSKANSPQVTREIETSRTKLK